MVSSFFIDHRRLTAALITLGQCKHCLSLVGAGRPSLGFDHRRLLTALITLGQCKHCLSLVGAGRPSLGFDHRRLLTALITNLYFFPLVSIYMSVLGNNDT